MRRWYIYIYHHNTTCQMPFERQCPKTFQSGSNNFHKSIWNLISRRVCLYFNTWKILSGCTLGWCRIRATFAWILHCPEQRDHLHARSQPPLFFNGGECAIARRPRKKGACTSDYLAMRGSCHTTSALLRWAPLQNMGTSFAWLSCRASTAGAAQ